MISAADLVQTSEISRTSIAEDRANCECGCELPSQRGFIVIGGRAECQKNLSIWTITGKRSSKSTKHHWLYLQFIDKKLLSEVEAGGGGRVKIHYGQRREAPLIFDSLSVRFSITYDTIAVDERKTFDTKIWENYVANK